LTSEGILLSCWYELLSVETIRDRTSERSPEWYEDF
jgi:hypothetical protein